VFPVAGEDLWCAVTVEDDAAWVGFTAALRHPEWAMDPRFATLADRKANESVLEELITQVTRGWTGGELVDALQARGVAAAVMETSGDLLANPQLVARGYWDRLEHPYMGTIVVNRAPFRSKPDEGAPRSAAPLLGQHTRELAASVLGIEDDEYADLVAREVFA
jgi:crotonobetainyl-CoA:carnitine CoA-transferase CaiB-like acyl-CoA transferase